MEIKSFDTSTDLVNLQMSDMPKEAKSNNTTVSIADTPQGTPAIYFSEQRITFKPNKDAERGRISVVIDKDGEQLTAESSEDYLPQEVPDKPADPKPTVTSLYPPKQKNGGQVNLGGKYLTNVIAVRVGLFPADQTQSFSTHTDDKITFRVPQNTLWGEKQIWIKDKSSGTFSSTRFKLTVLN